MLPSHPSIFNEDGTIKEPNFLWEGEGYQEAYMSAWMDVVVLICQKQAELSMLTYTFVPPEDEAVYRSTGPDEQEMAAFNRSLGTDTQREADRARAAELNQEISALLARVTTLKRHWDRVAQIG